VQVWSWRCSRGFRLAQPISCASGYIWLLLFAALLLLYCIKAGIRHNGSLHLAVLQPHSTVLVSVLPFRHQKFSLLKLLLSSYNSRSQNISVYDVALHRSIAVTAGVLWALVVSRIWWPSEARRELGVGLSDFLLNVSWLYNASLSNIGVARADERMCFRSDLSARTRSPLKN
jgi:hypothetical protein